MMLRIGAAAAAVALFVGPSSAQIPKGYNTWSFEGQYALLRAVQAERAADEAAAAVARSARSAPRPTPPGRVTTITVRPGRPPARPNTSR